MARSWLSPFWINWADLNDDDPDPRLQPVDLQMPPEEAVTWVAEVLKSQPRWQILSIDPVAGTIHAVHITILWRFRDDVQIRFERRWANCRMYAHSQARLGKADFGKNAENLRELTDVVRQAWIKKRES